MGEVGFQIEGLCADCGATELLTELWLLGETSGKEFEKLVEAANAEVMRRVEKMTSSRPNCEKTSIVRETVFFLDRYR